MLTFRPISYNDSDFRAFKYTGSSSIKEGTFCLLAASTSQWIMTCTLFNSAIATLPTSETGATVYLYASGLVFPVFREDPDPENVTPTIDTNDYVIGMQLHPGSEFQVHLSALHNSGSLDLFTAVNQKVCLATSGKLCVAGVASDSGIRVGVVVATLNGAWLRVRCL